MSNPEMALYLEKEHLRDAEESDYKLMQDLIEKRFYSSDGDRDERFENNAFFLTVADEVTDYRRYALNDGEKRGISVDRGESFRSLRRSSAIEMKDLPTPCVGDSPYSFPEGVQRMNSSSSADTSGQNGKNAKATDPNYVVMCESEPGETHPSKETELLSLQGNHSGPPGDADSSSEVFDGEEGRRSSERAGHEEPERLRAPAEGGHRRRLSRQESHCLEVLPRRRNASDSEPGTSQRCCRESEQPTKEQAPRPTIMRKLSRQESQGKVGRQNLLAIECNLALSHASKRVSSQPTLPPQQEEDVAENAQKREKGSQDSLMMPSETMC